MTEEEVEAVPTPWVGDTINTWLKYRLINNPRKIGSGITVGAEGLHTWIFLVRT
jgi:hypothetical protein